MRLFIIINFISIVSNSSINHIDSIINNNLYTSNSSNSSIISN